jgi:hypothetical protein
MTTPRELLAVPFALARVPLYIVDTQLIARLPRRSGSRLALDCGLGAVDVWAGRILGNEAISASGLTRLAAALRAHYAQAGPARVSGVRPEHTEAITRRSYATTRPTRNARTSATRGR